MKIRQLDLIRIGPFTNQTLNFHKNDANFHLVYGPNEAGKSSSLRALTQWLFGIAGETKCRDHFVHPYKDLRIGGTIENHDGQTLTCIRRPGGQTSLKAANDRTKIDPSELAAFLGNITREQFETQFGIDIHQLVVGGQAIASGGGEIGESLFAAGSGAAHMPSIQKGLDAACESLFKSASVSKKPMINAAIAELTAARKTVKDISVKSRDWQRQADQLNELREKKTQLDTKQIELHSARERLTRITDALPTIGEWKDKQAELSELGQAVRLRADFTTQRVEVTATLAAAQTAQQIASDEVESLDKKLEAIGQPSSILGHGSAIENLFKDLSLYRQWLQSLPLVSAECQQLQTRAKDALRTLGKEPELEQADGLRIGPAARVRIRELAEQRSGLLAAIEQADRELARRKKELAQRTAELESLTEPEDLASLKKSIAAAQKLGDLDESIATQAAELEQSNATAQNMLKRLSLWSGSWDEIESLSVPTLETVQRFTHDFERIDHAIMQLDGELQKINDEIASAEESLHALAMGVDVPTEESLAQARIRRDAKWDQIRELISKPTDAIDDSIGDATRDFTGLVQESDEISDRLRREAQRVSEKARLLGVMQRCRMQLEQRTAAHQEARSQRQTLVESWLAVWQPINITPLTPSEMNGWLGRHAELVALVSQIRKQRSVLQQSCDTRDKHIADLQLHGVQRGKETGLAPVLDACVDRLDTSNQTLNRIRQLKDKIADLHQQTKIAEDASAQAEQAKLAWQSQWQQAMVALNSDEDLSATQAQAVLDTIDQLIGDIDSAAKLSDQSKTQQQQIDGFEARVRESASTLQRDVDDTSVEQLVADWHDQLKQAREDQTSRDHLLVQKENAEKQKLAAAATIQTHLSVLQQLCAEAGCPTSDQLPMVEDRSRQRHQIEQAIAEKASELRGLAQGMELDAFIADALGEDPDALAPRIEQLTEQIQRVERERTELSEMIGAAQKDLDRIDGSDQAAMANQNAEEIIARMRTHVENYVRNKVGSKMLRTAVARYRQRNQGPVLARASELFAKFTLGSFAGLDTDSNDADENILVGVRIAGEGNVAGANVGDRQLVTASEMSEGTCDQLFLALRIASLEWYLKSNPPVPFIVDDILLKFDDARSAATLACLGELSRQTQVIMFTHHRHLIDVAESALPAEELRVHSLDGSLDGPTPRPRRKKTKRAETATGELF